MTGDIAARDALVERFLPLAKHLARRYGRDSYHAEDLFQVASLGLLKAIDRFDSDRGIAFSSFATPTIVGELKRYFRDKSWTVRVPRDLQDRTLNVQRAGDKLEGELGRVPTAAQVAERVGLTRRSRCSRPAWPPARATGSRSNAPAATATTRSPRSATGSAGGRGAVARGGHGDRRAADVVPRRTRAHHPPPALPRGSDAEEIAERLGLSQMHVSRLIRQSITRLRDEAGA